MKHLTVKLWGEELGRLVCDSSSNTSYFTFNPNAPDRPDVAPLTNPKNSWRKEMPVFGDQRRIYQGLPPFIADSLPDSWGNKLFTQWVKHSGISRHKVTPLLKLMFIGQRGMGALEFEPAAKDLEHRKSIDINELYSLSLEILKERESVSLDASKELTMQTLLAVSTSAGGRQMKAIVAFNPVTQEMRSGQTDAPPGYDYFIIKFEDALVPTTEIEMAYYEMALLCGIDMEFCQPLTVDGTTHFMTRRFDRKKGNKVHMQTLAAINPEADSYEDLMDTCRMLDLTEKEIIQVFRRLVFNIIANNTDDHNKNFSFLLERNGKWKLAPAYDMTFIFNLHASGPETAHVFSLNGKTSDVTKDELLEFAKENGIRDAESIIAEVGNSISKFPEFADNYQIPNPWNHIIQRTLHENLTKFGFLDFPDKISEFTDSHGRKFHAISINTNTKGFYHIAVHLDNRPRKRIIKPKSESFERLRQYELGKLDNAEFISLIEELFADK